MSRWHEPSCSRPKVQVLGGLPCCMDCFAVASLDDIEVESAGGPREPPTDESGTFNLTWPSCVEYVESEAKGGVGPSGSTAAEVPQLKRKASTISETSLTDNHKRTKEVAEEDNLENGFSAPSTSFQYEPLLNRNDIRLLHLESGNGASLLHASFSTSNLDAEGTAYDALSYTWADSLGNTDCCRPLFVGLFWDIVPITRNCEQALRSVRHSTGKPRKIWVDSVCINQNDANERSFQVALMTRIYSRATEVLVFLGPAADNSAMALAAITRSLN
ncbi:heterokaryon incompatibility protein [Colletotrichum musicola]|uniref:Heterokaryon incompatibility protein n=1 Tax=Colletotrichum musicola TaxID=2175873 RepID=A0A8H6NFB9_9PEZI|nr:heterokaryon incompatibility protein [Colletotrichum musicola]